MNDEKIIRVPDGVYRQDDDGQGWTLVENYPSQEQLEKIAEELAPCIEALTATARAVSEALTEAMGSFIKALAETGKRLAPVFKNLARYLNDQTWLEKCPNRRVVHLAKHAKKARTRKKNLRRAMRIIEKEAHR